MSKRNGTLGIAALFVAGLMIVSMVPTASAAEVTVDQDDGIAVTQDNHCDDKPYHTELVCRATAAIGHIWKAIDELLPPIETPEIEHVFDARIAQ